MHRTISPGISKWINTKIKLEYAMNVKNAFALMGKVGNLLRVSYAGCKGHNCQIDIDHMTSETKGNAHEGEGSVEKEEARPQAATSAEAEKVRQYKEREQALKYKKEKARIDRLDRLAREKAHLYNL